MDDTALNADTGASDIDLPGFLAIEAGDGELPVAIAWSLPDGRIKQTLIQPDPGWLEDDSVSFGDYSEEQLNTLGLTTLEVIRELEADYHGATLHTPGVVDEQAILASLFASCGTEPFVELMPAEQLYEELPEDEWREQRGELFNELGLEPLRAEDELQVMLTLHMRFQDEDDSGALPGAGFGPDADEE
ncbi:hypothetical protein C7446_2399 [Kushneria sinocarnis]|uniref:Uncharacterized protein n=1 Tax=Kushneria sinocarnis TaxID=595502 RepID=A0A420WVT6_9GAMM|nr:hypothetical protein [Kushneria sinocarnis]RKR02678.1 hypothetical protein C7446_2399 [Kushneria sinocarnis]